MAAAMTTSFDESLSAFAQVLERAGVDLSEHAGTVVRDSRGRLSFIASGTISTEVADRVNGLIDGDLRAYVSPLGPIADQDAPGAKRVFSDKDARLIGIKLENDRDLAIKFLDRRAIGADWLHQPLSDTPAPPRLVFASVKGGVGRSTALSVLAADLAERGFSLLVVDLDLEAPGIGSMLIDRTAVPVFGSMDFFVESGLKIIPDNFMLDCLGSSWLGGGRGRIDVVPSLGSKSLNNPVGVLAKLARAYLETPSPDGEPQQTFLTRAQDLLNRLTSLNRYDAVLVDARAGLHETTAAAILGLGADVLLFGVDQLQTEIGYDVLLSHLAQFPVLDADADWRYRLRMVQAKAEPSEAVLARYRMKMYDLFERTFYSREPISGTDIIDASFRFSVDDGDGPHFPIPIFEDERYRLFDPVQDRTQLARELYGTSFNQFVEFCVERLRLNEE
jgi:hypothetical protein